MKLQTLTRVLNWFNEYQWDSDRDEAIKLYQRLINEETEELEKAIEKENLAEILDAIWDILWVEIWHSYFYNTVHSPEAVIQDINNAIDKLYKYVEFKDMWWEYWAMILDDIMNAIADSNYTKTKEKQKDWEKKGKIIKWPNYKEPNLEPIINKYNLKLKTE